MKTSLPVLKMYLVAFTFVVPVGIHAATTYYVATNGLDSAAGTLVAPFRSIQKAASVMLPGDTCYVRGGTYRETVTPANSGTTDQPITYQNYSNEVAIINGTEVIKKWKRDSGKIYKAPMAGNFFVSPYNESDQVFVDGQMMTLAKWPNTTTATNAYPGGAVPPVDISHPAKSTITTFVSKQRRDNLSTSVFIDTALPPKPAGFYDGSQIYLQPNNGAWSWTLSGTVSNVPAGGNQITFTTPSNEGQDGNKSVYARGSRYYLFNKKEFLDNNGEWFHDKPTGLLYLQMPDGGSPARHLVEARARDYAFNLDSRSNIVVRGFNLFGCTITTDLASGGSNQGYDAGNKEIFPWRSDNSFASANHITLDRINAKYLWHFTDVSGHFFMQWGQSSGIVLSGDDNVLMNSKLQYSAGNGVSVLGHRSKVLNNVISDTDYNTTDCAFINTGGGTQYDIEIASNICVRTGRSGITPRGLVNSNPTNPVARIHHNDISQCMIQDWDGGSIYNCGDGQFVRIDHNLLHDDSNYSGIYLDYSQNYIVDHNVVWNIDRGIQLQGDRSANILCYNNTLSVKSCGFLDEVGRNPGTVIQNNIIFSQNNTPGFIPVHTGFSKSTVTNNLVWNNVPGSPTDPKFVDAANHNYRLQVGSPANHAGMVVPAYVRDGLTVPAFNEATDGVPNQGAY